MIDLTKKDLPKAIEVNGKSILLNTDFRVWLEFFKTNKVIYGNLIKNIKELTLNDKEELDIKLEEFLYNKNEYPQYESGSSENESGSSEKIIDYYLDGEYIYSAFMTQYHIDLLETDMHWHKFKALVDDLEVGIISHAKRARGYQKPSKKATEHDYWSKEKRAWQIKESVKLTEEEKAKIKEFEDYFDGA